SVGLTPDYSQAEEAGVPDAEPSSTQAMRRGLVTSAPCPLSCKDLGVPQEQCRSWQQGDRCLVEDLGQPAGHRSMARVRPGEYADSRSAAPRQAGASSSGAAWPSVAAGDGRRGLVTSSTCPYTCKMARVPAEMCREWKQGDVCMIEDFGQVPGHRTRVAIP
ncbi:MAG: hypothetical protein KDD62_11365, partial [Bdellovibrionales bacterium]|nr:hypothetical protein [Bdellovibrionales bacterium]